MQVTDSIYLILENELAHGAKIEIEYEITAYALNGISGLTITDYVGDTGLDYDPEAKLLTEDRTNEEVGWKVNSEGVTTTFSSGDSGGSMPSSISKKIVLSKLISTNDDNVYINTAVCSTASYGVGQSVASTFKREVTSEAVTIIPPTGENYVIIIAIASFVILIIILTTIKIKTRRNHKS